MKMKKMIAVFVSIMLSMIQGMLMTATPSAASTEPKQEEVFLSEFFELSMSEIETELGDFYSPAEQQLSGMIMVGVTQNQLQKLLSELEQQRAQIKDIDCFHQAFFELFLEKLHLKGIYEIADPNYRDAIYSIGHLDFNIQGQYTAPTIEAEAWRPICLRFSNYTSSEYPFSIDYQGETKKLSVNEMTKRALYVILKYGDRDYFEDAHEETAGVLVLPDNSNDILCGDVDCNGAVQIADAVLLARYLAEDPVEVSAQGLLNAELDGNPESLDAGDFAALLQIIAGVDSD